MGTSASAVSPVPRHRKQFGWVDAHGADADNGPLYMRQRWYDPTLQRFISRDPIGLAGGANLYTYAGNSPVAVVDPDGLKAPSGPVGYVIELLDNGFRVVSEALTFDELVEKAREGYDILCKDRKLAKLVAETAGNGTPVGPERHRPRVDRQRSGKSGRNFRGHFHQAGRIGGHIFFGLPPLLDVFGAINQVRDLSRGQLTAPAPDFVPGLEYPETRWLPGSVLPIPQRVYPDTPEWRNLIETEAETIY